MPPPRQNGSGSQRRRMSTPTRGRTYNYNIYPPEVSQESVWGLCKTYFWEWVAVIILGVGGAALELVTPYQREAFGMDLSISYPLISETVPVWALGVICVPIPMAIILLVSCLTPGIPRNYDIHTSMLGLWTSLAFTFIFTQIIKISVGALRPNFLARCDPDYDMTDLLRRVIRCKGDPAIIKEGRKSFFSGHSSFSFAAMFFLSLYLSRHLNFRRPPIGLKYIICLLPLVTSSLIAISRVDNYWHRWQDVFIGAVVGSIVALVSYRYHHPPSHPDAMGETDKLVDEDEESMIGALPGGTNMFDDGGRRVSFTDQSNPAMPMTDLNPRNNRVEGEVVAPHTGQQSGQQLLPSMGLAPPGAREVASPLPMPANN